MIWHIQEMNNSVYYLLILAAIGMGLHLIWKLLEGISRRNRRLVEKARYEAGEAGMCRYGANAAGEISRVRVKRSRKEVLNVS